jgi:hypothetical protein
MMLTFARIDKTAHSATPRTAWVVCSAMMNGRFDHHGMQFSCRFDIEWTDVGFDHALDLVIGGP